jgi:hypothetical protein
MAFSDFFFGQPNRIEQVNKFNPQQQQGLQQLLSQGLQGLQNPSQGFEPIKQDALNTFKEQIVPYLFSQLNAQGGQISISSPQVHSNLSSAGSSLAQRLAALQQGYAQQNQQNSLNQLRLGLQPQQENFQVQGSEGLLGILLPLLAKFGIGAASGGLGFLPGLESGGGLSALQGGLSFLGNGFNR